MAKQGYRGSNGAVTADARGFAFEPTFRVQYWQSTTLQKVNGNYCAALGGWSNPVGINVSSNTIYRTSGNYYSTGNKTYDGDVVGSISQITLYTLTAIAGSGGSLSGGGDYVAGASATVTATPNSGYVVKSINGEEQVVSSGSKNLTVPMSFDVTVTAEFQPFYRIQFNANGGTGAAPNIIVPCVAGKQYEIPACTLAKEGFEFAGWATTKSDAAAGSVACGPVGPYSLASFSAGKTVVLYAVWRQYTLAYDANGGETTPASQTGYGDVVLAAAVSRAGRTFLGWMIGEEVYGAGATYSLAADATAVAQWTDISIRNDGAAKSIGTLSLFDVTLGRKVADESDGYLQHSGVDGHVYRVDCVVLDFLYEVGGVSVNGDLENLITQFTFSGSDVEGVYCYKDKPLYTFEVVSAHGAVAVSPDPDDAEGGRYARGRTVSLAIAPDPGYEARRVTFVNVDTNDVYHAEVKGGAASLDGIVFNARAVVDYALVDYALSASVDPASAGAVASVSVSAGGEAAETAHWGDEAAFSATVADGYSFAGWYGADGALVSEETEYAATVSGALALVAKAKVAVSLGISYTGEGARSCALAVDGAPYEPGTPFSVVLGGSFAYALTLGERADGAAWAFDCWAGADGSPLPHPRDGTLAPAAALSMTARVAASVTRALDVYVARVGDAAASLVDADDVPGAVSCRGTAAEAEASAGGDGEADPFSFTFHQTQRVTVSALDEVTPPGEGGALSFYCLSSDAPGAFEGGVPPDSGVVSWEASAAVMLNAERLALYAYYGAPKAVVTTLAYAAASDATMGSLAVVAVDPDDAAAEIGADGMSATATQGKSVTMRATPANGWRFAGWFLDAAAAGDPAFAAATAEVRVTAKRTLYAKFAKDAHAICEWEGSSERKALVWRSKVYESSRPAALSACRVDARGYAGDGAGTLLELTVSAFSSPDAAPTAETTLRNIASQDARRLPMRRPERFLQVAVKANVEVDALLVGTSMGGLAL